MTSSRVRTGTWSVTEDVGEFEARAGELLRSGPALNTVPLGIVERVRAAGGAGEGARFGVWARGGGRTEGYFVWTPPRPLYVTLLDREAARALVDALRGQPVDGVIGTEEATGALAGAWRERHIGGRAERVMRQRLFRLAALRPPHPLPDGGPRVAGAADRELLADWHQAFAEEAHTRDGAAREQAERWATDRIAYGGVTLWEDARGVPVSMAGVTRRAAGAVRVAPVYTPPEWRGQGYGGAVTAEASGAARAAGAEEVLLFTDLANPTSNALYQRLGYRPVRDFAVWEFAD